MGLAVANLARVLGEPEVQHEVAVRYPVDRGRGAARHAVECDGFAGKPAVEQSHDGPVGNSGRRHGQESTSSSQGLMIGTSVHSKSFTLRVTTVRLWAMAVA